ncbi:alpha/beta fold hydrolase [Marivibrio halodurans]|uniref:Alpha/beta fold hydrolase n=1 Tax=Marivibrio halodurans TaxID=2039722 RepID=A0A8J7SKR2_9PROT|nr:alpha/beta fold hydrolase [Marivibrio halodurans]MBP5856368.1 alpha/beta fold hydrolase [Marivibrio halodurans]
MPLTLATTDLSTDRSETPLVILHGLFGQRKNWTSLQKQFARSRPAIAADLRNHGESPWDDAMDYPAMAADVAALIEGVPGGGPADVLGHSMGGKVAMMLALTRPELVARLIVVDIAPAPSTAGGLAAYAEAMRALDLSGVTRRGDADSMLADAVPDQSVRAFLLTNLAREGEGYGWQPNLDVLAARMDDIEGFPEPEDGATPYEGETLFIAGGKSDYVGPQHQAAIDRLFPRARIDTIPSAGHWVHAEAPRPFMETALGFLDD